MLLPCLLLLEESRDSLAEMEKVRGWELRVSFYSSCKSSFAPQAPLVGEA